MSSPEETNTQVAPARRRPLRVFAAALAAFLAYAIVHQFGWATGALILFGFMLLAVVGWLLPVPGNGRHADPAGQGWRGPTL